jgi:hypothetical protein
MKTTKLIYHETLYNVENFTDVVRFYRHFSQNNTTKRKISDLIASGVFNYCQYNDYYFHVRSSSYITVVDTTTKDLTPYYTGTHNTYNRAVRMCSYNREHFFRADYNWIELHSGGFVNDELYGTSVLEYSGRYFLTQQDLDIWKAANVKYVSSYHSDSSREYCFDDIKPERFKVGFECEKEDIKVRNSLSITEFKNITGGYWRKESDSSLDSRNGFELISPIMDFNVDRIQEYLKQFPVLLEHINADFNTITCGGHINISDTEQNGPELFESISGYVPVLYSMYSNRLSNSYSVGQKKEELKRGSRAAICVKSERIEIRIFSAIRNIDVLLFRLRLVRFMLDNFTSDPAQAVKNLRSNSELFNGIYSRDILARMLRRAEILGEDYNFANNAKSYAELA